MILQEDIVAVGRLLKPHGIKGEITLLFDNPSFHQIDSPFFIIEMDGLFVPFFVEEKRVGTDVSVRVKFEDVDDEISVSKFSNKTVYLPKTLIKEQKEVNDVDFLIGYLAVDKTFGELGEIVDIDTSTINNLFVVISPDEEEILIPIAEEFIEGIDEKEKMILFNLPEGLLNYEDALMEE